MRTIEQAILNSAGYTIISTDTRGIILLFNKAAEKLLGYSAGEVVGKHTPELFHSREEIEKRAETLTRELGIFIEPGFEVFAAKARLSTPDEQEWSYVKKDGSSIPVLLSITPLYDPAGAITGFLGIGKDISERRRTESRLALFTRAIEETIDGVQITELNGEILYSNRAAEEMYGFGPDELRGLHVNELNADREFVRRTIVPSINKNGRWTGEVLAKHKQGRKFPVWLSASVVRDNSGKPAAIVGIIRDITGQKQAERAMRESHENFLAMLDGLDALVYVTDMVTHEILFLNEYGRTAFGDSAGKICWQTIQAGQTGPCSYCTNGKLLDQAGRPTGVYAWEFRNTVNGRWYDIRDRAIPWIDDRLVRLEIAVDMTSRKLTEEALRRTRDELERRVQERTAELEQANERLKRDAIALKRTQEELRESESKYRAIVEHTGTATVIIEPDTIISHANTQFELLSGFSRAELEGKRSWKDFVHPDDTARMKTFHELRRKTAADAPRHYDFRFLDRTGATKDIFLSVGVIPGTNKSVASLLDITERKHAEDRLQEQLDFLQVLIDTIPSPIYYKDALGRYLGCNQAFEKCIGVRRNGIVGKTTYDVASKEIADVQREMDEKLFEQGGSQEYEGSALFCDGTVRTVIFTKALFRKNDGAVGGLVGMMVDMTEHRKLEDQLRQAQKMEAVGLLAGGIAHDFNNLLTAILGYSDLIGAEQDRDMPFRSEIRAINEAAVRAAGLTRQLLAFSRKQMLEMRVINLNELIDNVAKFLRRIIGEDIEIEFHTGKTIRNIMADPGQIEQVLMNLAINARDAMPRGGKIIIETANTRPGARSIPGQDRAGSAFSVVLSLRDTGIGMHKEVQEKIFEPFFTTKGLGRGTGLGLSTVYGIVKQHEGEIEVESDPGKGTTFRIYLPAIDAGTFPGDELHEPPLPGGTETILVVDDDNAVREVLVALLGALGYRTLSARGARDALRVSKSCGETIHLLLTDVAMPGMDGKELAAFIKQKHPETEVMFMSGYTDEAVEYQGVIEPTLNFIQKPVALHKLAQKLRDLLDRTRKR